MGENASLSESCFKIFLVAGIFLLRVPKTVHGRSEDDAMVSREVIKRQNRQIPEGIRRVYEKGLQKQTEKSLRQTRSQLIENHSLGIVTSRSVSG